MAKKSRAETEEIELNLAPIMNLVMILIPLLLLSVVFEQMGVINVSAPKLSVGPVNAEPQPDEKPPLNLTVAVSASGFTVAGEGNVLPPLSGCPEGGTATVCVKKGKDIKAMMDEVKSIRARYDSAPSKANRQFIDKSDEKLKEVVEAYDWRRLYNTLAEIKKKFPEETVVNLTADQSIPFELVVKAMDTMRFKLDSGSDDGKFPEEKAFMIANYKKDGTDKSFAPLFPDVVLAIAQ